MKRRIIAMIMIFAMVAMGMTGCAKAPAKANESETGTEAVTKVNSTKAEKETTKQEAIKNTESNTEGSEATEIAETEPIHETQASPVQTEAPKQENIKQSSGTAGNTPAEPAQVQMEAPKTEAPAPTEAPTQTEAETEISEEDIEGWWDEWCYNPLPPVLPDSLEYRINHGTAGLDELRQFILEGFNYTMLNAKTNQHEVFLDDRYNASAQWYAEYLERTYYDLSKCGPSCHSGGQLEHLGIEVALHEGIFQTDTTMGAMQIHARYMPTHMLVEGSKLEKIGIGIVYVDRIPGYICVIQSYDRDIVDGQVTEYTIPDLPDINTIPILHSKEVYPYS